MTAPTAQPLAQLLLRAQTGDRPSYEAFLTNASELLVPFIRKRIDREEFLDDILQDTLIAVHRSQHTYLPDRSVEAWLYVICAHRLTDFYRKVRRVERSAVMDVDLSLHVTTEGAPVSLDDLLATLPERQKEVITLMKLEGFTVKEVSKKLSLSESAVKVTAFRGYEALKRLKGIF